MGQLLSQSRSAIFFANCGFRLGLQRSLPDVNEMCPPLVLQKPGCASDNGRLTQSSRKPNYLDQIILDVMIFQSFRLLNRLSEFVLLSSITLLSAFTKSLRSRLKHKISPSGNDDDQQVATLNSPSNTHNGCLSR